MRSFLALPLLAGAILSTLVPGINAAEDLQRNVARSTKHNEVFAKRDDYPLPLQDPFYHRPKNLSSYKPGDVIRARKIEPKMDGVAGHVGDTWQIFYRTTNADHHPSSTVTTVIRPKGNPDTHKMLSYHLWEDAVQRNCAPSYTILKGNESPNVKVVGADVPIWFNFLLANGISVVVPDYEGPKSALFSGFTGGYAILDSARAVINHLGWAADAEVSMTGYSEGAHVTAWAANLQPSYAPNLNVVGAVHGGTPIDMETTLKRFDGSEFSGFTLGGIHGMMVAYKKFRKAITQYGDDELHKDLKAVVQPDVCHAKLRGPDYSGKQYFEGNIHPPTGEDVYQWEPVRHVLEKETLWANKSSVGVGYPKFPRMIYQGDHDDVISYAAVEHYVKEQCKGGADIQFNVYSANAHTAPQVVIGGDLVAMRFVLESHRIGSHRPRKVQCGMPTPTLLNLGTWLVNAILGGNIAQSFENIFGQVHVFRDIGFGPHPNQKNELN